MQELCSDQDLETLIATLRSNENGALKQVDILLESHARDARLHFMRGSMLIGAGKLIEAYAALSRAVDIAPDFAIARFQLGFFQLTSGEANNAIVTWQPLDDLEDGHYLKLFVNGLRYLIRDEFDPAFEFLRQGMQANQENLPLNSDIQLLMDQCTSQGVTFSGDTETAVETAPEKESVSPTSLILGQLLGRGKRRSN